MSNLKEILQQIKNDYAKEQGYTYMDTMVSYVGICSFDLDEICKRYAEEVIKEASDRAEISISGNEIFLELLNSDEENDINSEDLANCKITVSKQSILKLIDEL